MPEKQLPAVIQAVESRLPEIRKLLPADVSADTFLSHFKTAAMQTRDLLDASPRSVVLACVRAANDGLVLDGREAVIVVRNAKRRDGTWEKVAVYQRMYGGTLKRVRQALPGCTIEARLVHEKDTFELVLGDEPSLLHKPKLGPSKGAIVGVYAVVTEANGTKHRDVMEVDEIERIRDGSQNYDPTKPKGPWHDHFGEMAKKTCLNRLAKLLPQATGRPPLQADADDTGGADDEVEVYDTATVALPQDEPAHKQQVEHAQDAQPAQGKVEFMPPAKEWPRTHPDPKLPPPEEAPPSDVTTWKTRLRELRGYVNESLTKLSVEEEWNAWEERYKPVPNEVVTAAKGLIDKRLAVIEEAVKEYEKAQGE